MGCFLHVLLSPPVFLEFLLCGWGSSPLLPLYVCLRDVLQLPSLLGLLLDHVPPQPNYSAASFFCHQCPQSFTPALSSPLFLSSVMALVLLLSLCCCQELAPEAGCALPFAGAVAIFCKMVQLSSVCILLLILSFVFLVLQSRLPLQRLTVQNCKESNANVISN